MADNKCDTASCGGNCDTCDGNITVTLTLDNDETVECVILTIFPVNGWRPPIPVPHSYKLQQLRMAVKASANVRRASRVGTNSVPVVMAT